MSENGLEIEETQTTDINTQDPDGPRSEERSPGDERLFAWRANYMGRKQNRSRVLTRTTVPLIAAGLIGVLGAVLLTPDSDKQTTASTPSKASVMSPNTADSLQPIVEEIKVPNAAIEPESTFNPKIHMDTVKLWQLNGFAWVQFDYEYDERIFLHWFDAKKRSSLNPIECKDRLRNGDRRCYYGRSYARINQSLGRGYEPGQWGVFACNDYEGTDCVPIGEWTITSPME